MAAWCAGRLAGVIVGLAVWGSASAVAAGEPPAIETEPTFVASYMKGFMSACTKGVKGDPDIGKIACACAAAVIADRFTIDELKSLQGKGIADYDKIHPVTSKLIGVCGQAGKASVEN